MVAPGGHAWLLPGGRGMHSCSRGCAWLLWGGMHGCSQGGVCHCSGGHAWLLLGGCVVAPGGACVVALGGCVAARGSMHGIRQHMEIQSLSGQYASYWNAFLFDFCVKDVNGEGEDTSTLLMLFSIVLCFGNMFLLCLERLDADWLNGCVCLEALHSDCFYCMWYLLCLEILHSDCFCCMWYCYHAFSLDECPSSPAGGRIFCCPCILIG